MCQSSTSRIFGEARGTCRYSWERLAQQVYQASIAQENLPATVSLQLKRANIGSMSA